ncbi:transporter substrate-binding domain-containing protein [Pseudomonas sp. N3-W]|uniref:Transporter substrate-binding domain-containing protein n=1 Tax=Pseudomonas fungipugnans TaxID=3024217 RepID=A0ABT6QYF4_9PSED|nr:MULTISPECIES: transporter substrate-binding domain-containing protein [unclassified Pseudomonas]MDI2595334.1 transporter substrate-binding domain-containing protein [Pseudomonas sp. 681]UWF51618.1 transporter substrate-binding domain-containing protein [Pseudomonas sp. N3-W]
MKRIAACLLSLLAFNSFASELRMLTDNHPPLHFQQGNELVGFGVDVVRALAQQTGDTVQLQQVPLLRALHMASTEADTAVFTVLRNRERDERYQWVGPLLEVETALYAADNKQPPVSNLQQAESQGRIVVPRKWLAYDYLQKQGFNNLYGVETPEQMMRLLSLGRADFVVSDTLSYAALAREEGLSPSQLHYQMPLMKQGTYIAFSPRTDVAQVARWQQALEEMSKDGRLEKIRERWLADSKPN